MYIFGLGNPGEEYKNTRHNVGRMMLESIAKKDGFSPWKEDMKLRALVAKGELDGKKVIFIAPDNFMNNSGGSAKPLVATKKDLEKIIVIYDDLDLPLGKIKISYDRSSGGHNGLESIIKAVKSQAFVRIRVGLSPERKKGGVKRPDTDMMKDYLLKNFREKELNELKKVTKQVRGALEILVTEGRGKAMSLFN